MAANRKFPTPWTVRELASAYVVEDAEGRALSYSYWSPSFTGTGGDKLSKAEAFRVASWIAKSPGLLGS